MNRLLSDKVQDPEGHEETEKKFEWLLVKRKFLLQKIADKTLPVSITRLRMLGILKLDEEVFTPASLAQTIHLDLDTSESTSDVTTVEMADIAKSLKFRSRWEWVINQEDFRSWLMSEESEALCIQGHGDLEKISPLSFLISLIRHRISELYKRTLILTFFCGIHAVSSSDEETLPPLSLAKSILSQLLARSDIDGLPVLSYLKQETIFRLLGNSFSTYLQVISDVLVNYGGLYRVIFVMIDGYEYYDQTWESKMNRLITTMAKTIKSFNEYREDGGFTLKVLFTAATNSKTLECWKDSMKTIDMPKDIKGDRDGGESLGRLSIV